MPGLQPEVRLGALQRPRPELLDVLVEVAAHVADAVLARALDAEPSK